MKFTRENIKKSFLIISWALYDTANQFFALNVVSLYFPRWLTIEKNSPEIFYSISFGVSIFLVAVCAPILGAISDMRGRHKEFLIYFTLISIVFTMALGLSSNIFLGLLFFAIANFGCQGAVVFYNALMVKVAPRHRIGFVSGLGRTFGYGGAIMALYLTKPVILNMGYRATFFLTGILFLIFSLPCMIFIKEGPLKEKKSLNCFLEKEKILDIFRRLKETLSDSYRFSDLKNFLKAAFFVLCAVNTLILFMSVYISRVFGLRESEIIDLIAVSTIFAILGSILSGFVSDKIGYRKSLLGVFFLWGICLLGGALLDPPFHWVMGSLVGFSLGSIWVISRALVIKLAPHEKLGEIFGLFNLVSYLSGIVGPLFWGVILLYSSSLGLGQWGYRLACLSMVLFITIGFVFLLRMGKGVSRVI